MDQYLKQTPYSDPGDAPDLGGLPRDPGNSPALSEI